MGRYQVDQMTLYTSRGLGMEGYGAPRARLLCPPEIILWKFNDLNLRRYNFYFCGIIAHLIRKSALC